MAAAKGSTGTMLYYAANQAVVMGRDALVTRIRSRADKNGLDIRAKRLGKAKTVLQDSALAVLVSPAANTSTGFAIGAVTLAAGTALSVYSGAQIRNRLENSSGLPAYDKLPDNLETAAPPATMLEAGSFDRHFVEDGVLTQDAGFGADSLDDAG